MDPNAGNPYMQGSNPYMQGQPGDGSPPPVSPGDVMGEGMGGGASETTKPRQMPGGPADIPGPGNLGMPAPDGGASAIPTTESVPGAPSSAAGPTDPMKTGALLRQVRIDVTASNPDLSIREAHAIALRVVSMIVSEAAPLRPPPDPNPRRQQQQNRQQPRLGRDGLPVGDPRNPRNRNSVMHPNHPQHQDFYGNANTAGDDESDDGLWRPKAQGRDPLEDRANARGYQGNNPHLFGLADAVLDGIQRGKRYQKVRNKVEWGDKNTPIGAPVGRA